MTMIMIMMVITLIMRLMVETAMIMAVTAVNKNNLIFQFQLLCYMSNFNNNLSSKFICSLFSLI
jgi:hypothetical protein